MNNFSKLAVITAALALVAQGANAAVGNSEDLVLGFTDSSVANDYVIDLGQTSAIGVGVAGTTDLSADVLSSTFNSTFTTGTVTAGVAGGSSATAGTAYMTVTRAAAGNNTVADSSNPLLTAQAAGGAMSSATAKAIGSHAEGVTLGQVGNTTAASWTQNIVNFSQQQSSYTPQTTLSGTVYEDLYSTKNSSDTTWTYLGYFTINVSNPNSPDVTFTSAVAVPEPATYGCLAGAGLLLVALRRQFAQKLV